MHDPAAPPLRFLGLSASQAAILVITVATLFRFFYCTWLPMLPDETYYFQWSRHLDASYFSKGPAVAYTIAVGTRIFGDNHFGVRFFAVLLSAGTAWQIFLLARRWYDETAALLAVLLAGVIPLYAVGAVLMTIDPLSAFFWIWAAGLFSSALQQNRTIHWLLAGFAVGSGFLAKYLNALELISFLAFLAVVPSRRHLLLGRGFWLMLAAFLFCTIPVLWWNAQHGWASATQLGNRGHLQDHSHFSFSTFLYFLISQGLVVSPLLFVALLATAIVTVHRAWKMTDLAAREGEILLLFLFLTVFLFYALLAFHLRDEPNWPAVSYLTLVIILAGQWRSILASRFSRIFLAAAFCLAWCETVLLHDTEVFPLRASLDPMGRTAGWSDLALRADLLRQRYHADELLADGYKEASVLSFGMLGKPFVYCLRHQPPANQFDLWPPLLTSTPHRVLWVTYAKSPAAMATRFSRITPLELVQVWYRGALLRSYRIYLCENP